MRSKYFREMPPDAEFSTHIGGVGGLAGLAWGAAAAPATHRLEQADLVARAALECLQQASRQDLGTRVTQINRLALEEDAEHDIEHTKVVGREEAGSVLIDGRCQDRHPCRA